MHNKPVLHCGPRMLGHRRLHRLSLTADLLMLNNA